MLILSRQVVQVLSQLGTVNNNKINLLWYFIVRLGHNLDHFGVYEHYL